MRMLRALAFVALFAVSAGLPLRVAMAQDEAPAVPSVFADVDRQAETDLVGARSVLLRKAPDLIASGQATREQILQKAEELDRRIQAAIRASADDRRKALAEAEKKVAEDAAAKIEADKKAAEEAAAKVEADKKAADEAAKKAAEDAAAKIEADKKAVEEAAAKVEADKKAADEAAKKAAEDAAAKIEADKKAVEEAAAKAEADKKAADEAAKKAAEEAGAKAEADKKAADESVAKSETDRKAAEAVAKAAARAAFDGASSKLLEGAAESPEKARQDYLKVARDAVANGVIDRSAFASQLARFDSLVSAKIASQAAAGKVAAAAMAVQADAAAKAEADKKTADEAVKKAADDAAAKAEADKKTADEAVKKAADDAAAKANAAVREAWTTALDEARKLEAEGKPVDARRMVLAAGRTAAMSGAATRPEVLAHLKALDAAVAAEIAKSAPKAPVPAAVAVKAPEAPKAPEMPKAPEVAKAPETPAVPEPPKIPEPPTIPETRVPVSSVPPEGLVKDRPLDVPPPPPKGAPGDAPKTGVAAIDQGMSEQSRKILDEVSAETRRADERTEFIAQHYFQIGKQAYDSFDYVTAKENLEKCLQLSPKHGEARRFLERSRANLGERYDETRLTAEQAAGEEQAKTQAVTVELENYLALGRRHYEKEEYKLALDEFRRVKDRLRFIPWNVNVEGYRRQTDQLIEDTLRRQKEKEERIEREQYEIAIRIAQREQEVTVRRFDRRIWDLQTEARKAYRLKQYEKAESLCDDVLKLDPYNSDANRMRDMAIEKRHERDRLSISLIDREEFEKEMEENREAMIAYTGIIRYPSNWDEVLKRSATWRQFTESTEEPWKQQIQSKLQKPISFDFQNTPLRDVLEFLQGITGITMILDASAAQAADQNITLKVDGMKTENALNWVLRQAGLRYQLRDEALFVTSAAAAATPEDVQMRFYDVRDLTMGIVQFPGPAITLPVFGGADTEGATAGGTGLGFDLGPEAGGDMFSGENLAQFIRDNIAPGRWGPGTSIAFRDGNLIVNQTPDVHRLIVEYLNQMRSVRQLMVSVQARFITVRDDFLEDIGVDFRGSELALQGPSGVTGSDNALLTDVDQYADLPSVMDGVDPARIRSLAPLLLPVTDLLGSYFGLLAPIPYVPATLSPIAPSSAIDSGFISNRNSIHNDLLGRTENVFDEQLGRNLTRSGGLSIQYTFLDEFQVEAILRATQKSTKSSVLVAPMLTMFNTQRANIAMITQRSIVSGLNTVVADNAVGQQPVTTTIFDGVVLDVRPVVSADRRYVTMELRPTLAEILSIPVFNGIQLPVIRYSRMRTTVTSPDGGTIMIGGLMHGWQAEMYSGIPILSKIPIIKRFFRRDGRSDERNNTVILVKAKIIILEEEEQKLNPGPTP
ncbi:MAG: hypothetical protein AAB215_09610 [Planctomycetota bacterium]